MVLDINLKRAGAFNEFEKENGPNTITSRTPNLLGNDKPI
jgi:hypothetical protein